MKKMRMLSVLLAVVMLLTLLAGCTCKHEWKEANCGAPKTCTLCGETEGEKTTNHEWQDATTEAPKTCSVCGQTEGERIITDERFTTAACKDLFGTWSGELKVSAQQLGLDATGTISMYMEMTFSNDGHMISKSRLTDVKEYADLMSSVMYQAYADQGLDQASADQAMMNVYGQTVPEYCMATALEVDNSLKALQENYVYYIKDGQLYSAVDWESVMDCDSFRLENGALYIMVKTMGVEVELHREAK